MTIFFSKIKSKYAFKKDFGHTFQKHEKICYIFFFNIATNNFWNFELILNSLKNVEENEVYLLIPQQLFIKISPSFICMGNFYKTNNSSSSLIRIIKLRTCKTNLNLILCQPFIVLT